MKRFLILSLIVTVMMTVAGAAVFAAGARDGVVGGPQAGRGMGPGDGSGRGAAVNRNGGAGGYAAGEDIGALIAGIPAADVSEEELAGLLLMREEEKLARDVYAALYEVWNIPIFQSISRSEAQHMESMKLILDRYEIADPVGTDEPGVFEDEVLQGLYDELVEKGSGSLAAALTVGATIEDLDIADLERLIGESDNDDIRVVYQNLMKGSRNHIRSFVSQLERLGEEYAATYVSPEYLERTLSISREVAPITDPEYVL